MAKSGTVRPLAKAQSEARRVTHKASPGVVWLARLGYAARGIVYLIVGYLALQAAQGAGSPNVDTRRALATIFAQPYGKILLAIVAVGLIGYAAWRLVQAAEDPEHVGTKAKGILQRVGYAVSAFAYLGLAAAAVRLINGSGGAGNGNQAPKDWTARLLNQPFGRWLVMLAGLAAIAIAVNGLIQAYKASFEKRFKTREISGRPRRWAVNLGRLGYASRSVVYLIVGWFLIRAALESNPQRAGGLGDALQALGTQPYGTTVLAIVAAGLIAFGIYSLVLARYRRIYV
jgi:hypothetical protein